MENTPNTTPELLEFRKQIDALDDKLIALLIERIGIVSSVGEMKRQSHPGQCPIRAGREADMIRRIAAAFAGTGFLPAAGAAMWRLLIGASTTTEQAISVSAYAPDADPSLYWLAREYFGPFIPVGRQSHVKRVIGDVLDGKTSIGIVPMPRGNEENPWWTSLIQQGNDTPKIFAHIPFVHYGAPGRDAPMGLAISKIKPEPSSDDVTLLVIEADTNTSQSRLQSASATARLDAQWMGVTSLTSASRLHLVACKGFIDAGHAALKAMEKALGSALLKIHFLGAYATPFILENHAARPQK